MKKLKVKGEPKEVTEIRNKILNAFNELVFVEEGHKYYLRGEELTSVSHITHKFAQPFDEDKIATNYALKHGETKEYWLDKWKYNSLKATTTRNFGTRIRREYFLVKEWTSRVNNRIL